MNSDHTQQSETPRHEPLGADVGGIWQIGAALAATVALALLVVAGMIKLLETFEPSITAAEAAAEQVPMPVNIPQLDPDQPVELRQLRRREQALLDQYQWIDKPTGIARIPIDRAMQIIAAEGLPATESAPSPQTQSVQPPPNQSTEPAPAPTSELQ